MRELWFRGTGATASETAVVHAPFAIICICTYWRDAWKYQARTYGHFGWDNGTLLANLLAVATALGMPAKVICGFVDSEVNRLGVWGRHLSPLPQQPFRMPPWKPTCPQGSKSR